MHDECFQVREEFRVDALAVALLGMAFPPMVLLMLTMRFFQTFRYRQSTLETTNKVLCCLGCSDFRQDIAVDHHQRSHTEFKIRKVFGDAKEVYAS